MTSNLPERLWDQAYDDLKADKCTLIMAYERILSRERNINASSSIILEGAIEQTNQAMRRSQMFQLIQIGLKKTEKEAKVKLGIGKPIQVILSAKNTIGSVVQTAPQAALAWAGVCFALQVSFVHRNHNYEC